MSWSPSVDEAVEALDLIRTQDGADAAEELALLGVEAIARVAVHLLELGAVLVEDLAEGDALPFVELQLVGEPGRDGRREAGRSAETAPERWPIAASRTAAPAEAAVGVGWSVGAVGRRHMPSEDEAG